AEVFVLCMTVETRHPRLEDVGGRAPARGHAPSPSIEQQRRLRLCAAEAKLSAVGLAAPGGRIATEVAKAFGDILLGEPLDRACAASSDRGDLVGRYETDCPGAVFANVGQERERASGRDLKALRPALDDEFVVGKETPHVRVDDPVSMFYERQR